MSIVVVSASSPSPSSSATTTAQDIVNCVSRDLRSQLATSGTDSDIIIDYTNRIQLQMLRHSRWSFMLSAPQYFVTEDGQHRYWVGASGGNTQGTIDTGLNLTDFDRPQDNSVWDRSLHKQLVRTKERPLGPTGIDAIGQPLQGSPSQFRHDGLEEQNVLELYPAPSNQNTFEPTPAPPNIQSTVSGALAARTLFFRITLVDSLGGESVPSEAVRQRIATNSLAVVKSPKLLVTTFASGVAITGYKVYASATEGGEVVQNGGTAISMGSDWTEPGAGLATGTAAPPTDSTIEPMRGHLIEFRYYKARPQVTLLADVLMIPDVYKDVVCAGVSALSAKFLKMKEDAGEWFQVYQDGLEGMVRDRNLFPNVEFMTPDPASVYVSVLNS